VAGVVGFRVHVDFDELDSGFVEVVLDPIVETRTSGCV